MKVVIVANIPAPYREVIYSKLAQMEAIDLTVIYCKQIEDNRHWVLDEDRSYHCIFLQSATMVFGEHTFYFDYSVLRRLRQLNPDVVVTNAFAIPMLLAFLYSLITGKKHISFTDGTIHTESRLTIFHKIIRRLVYASSAAFIGPSEASRQLYLNRGVDEEKIFVSQLCIDNQKFSNDVDFESREYDLLYIGQIIDRKLPFFFVEIVRKLVTLRGQVSVLIAGAGDKKDEFLSALDSSGANVFFQGFVAQEKLPMIYRKAKLLLMTTREDCWGVVANEALASGTPVFTSPFAGAANELVLDKVTGAVIALDADLWAERANKVLSEREVWNRLSLQGRRHVRQFNYDTAAKGLWDALTYVDRLDV